MREEQLPQFISRRDAPRLRPQIRDLILHGIEQVSLSQSWIIVVHGGVLSGNAIPIVIAFAVRNISDIRRQRGLRDEDLAGVHGVAPFAQRQERDGVVDVRDAAVFQVGVVVWDFAVKGEARVEIFRQSDVSDARLAERGYLWRVASGQQV